MSGIAQRNGQSGRVLQAQPTQRERDLEAKLEKAMAAIAALQAARSPSLSVKVKTKAEGGKGTVCVYGLMRRPVSLYASQWRKLADYMPKVIAFIDSDPDGMTADKFADDDSDGE